MDGRVLARDSVQSFEIWTTIRKLKNAGIRFAVESYRQKEPRKDNCFAAWQFVAGAFSTWGFGIAYRISVHAEDLQKALDALGDDFVSDDRHGVGLAADEWNALKKTCVSVFATILLALAIVVRAQSAEAVGRNADGEADGVAAARISAVDIYSIADPKAALAAVRQKWPHAADRISMWDMPKCAKTFFEIDSLQGWCNDDPPKRYGHFEKACKQAIDLRIEPPIWYYNLACACAVQGKTNAAFEALEQATAAGIGVETTFGDDISKDSDFASITNDPRFAKLCAMMRADERQSWKMPRKFATEAGGVLDLTDDNVYWAFKNEAFWVRLKTTNDCPIVYVNRYANHPQAPCDGLISVRYPQEAVAARCNEGPANIYVTGESDDSFRVPTIIAGDAWLVDDRLNRPMSVPAMLAADLWLLQDDDLGQGRVAHRPAFVEQVHSGIRNVLGVYSVGSDYGRNGIDRFLGNLPIGIAHVGGVEESDKFVRLAAEAIRVLPKNARAYAAQLVPDLIRRSQKCVTSETDFMSGRAWRPTLRFADVDCAKVLAQAKNGKFFAPPPLVVFPWDSASLKTSKLQQIVGTDIKGAPFEGQIVGASLRHFAVVARTMARTVRIDGLKVEKGSEDDRGSLVWTVLQGDPQKVRVAHAKDGGVTIDVDYHEAFDVEWTDGAKIRTSRVDIGCFNVVGGVASAPSIVSVYFSPNETRQYDANGRIVSVDYTKPQIEEYCPKYCARGDWKDVFQWTDEGRLLGWTRTHETDSLSALAMGLPKGTAGIVTNVFTRDGFIVDSRDALGRPKNVHRSMRATWAQKLETATLRRSPIQRRDIDNFPMEYANLNFDFREDFRMEDFRALPTLAWKYAYEDDEDRFGTAVPDKGEMFKYDPGLCPRADFADTTTGFRLPFLDQVERGYEKYVGYRRDVVGWRIRDSLLGRGDSCLGMPGTGVLPQTLKKMRFCKWTPATNDVWLADVSPYEKRRADVLIRLPEGAYCEYDAEGVRSVGATLRMEHGVAVSWAIDELRMRHGQELSLNAFLNANEIRAYTADLVRRCGMGGQHVPDLCRCLFLGREWKCIPGVWEIADAECILVILWDGVGDASSGDGTLPARYRYCLYPASDGDGEKNLRMPVAFMQLPSHAIGNTVLRAWKGDADALNNLAVLLYAGVANPDAYDEKTVVELLERSIRKGNKTAAFNLKVLRENNGEYGVSEMSAKSGQFD